MYKNATYREKFADLKEWIPFLVEAIKKDLRNEHLKKDIFFVKKFLSSKNIHKITIFIPIYEIRWQHRSFIIIWIFHHTIKFQKNVCNKIFIGLTRSSLIYRLAHSFLIYILNNMFIFNI